MGPAESSAALVAVEVIVGMAPRQVIRVRVNLPAGSTVAQALEAARVGEMADALRPDMISAAIESGAWSVGVWGRKERLGHVLRDLDRIELVRPLNVDPKEARRVRYRAHGEKLPKGFQRPKAR